MLNVLTLKRGFKCVIIGGAFVHICMFSGQQLGWELAQRPVGSAETYVTIAQCRFWGIFHPILQYKFL